MANLQNMSISGMGQALWTVASIRGGPVCSMAEGARGPMTQTDLTPVAHPRVLPGVRADYLVLEHERGVPSGIVTPVSGGFAFWWQPGTEAVTVRVADGSQAPRARQGKEQDDGELQHLSSAMI
jgi:hypothetical protein